MNEPAAHPEPNFPGSFEASCGHVTKSSLTDSERKGSGPFVGGSVPSSLAILLSEGAKDFEVLRGMVEPAVEGTWSPQIPTWTKLPPGRNSLA